MVKHERNAAIATYLLALEQGDADALAHTLAAFPDCEQSLTVFALRDALTPTYPDRSALASAQLALTSRLKERAMATAFGHDLPVAVPLTSLVSRARTVGLDVPALAAAVDLPRDVLALLDRRLIAAAGIPMLAIRRLASALQTSTEAVQSYLAGGIRQRVAAFNFAAEPPQVGEQISFADSLQQSPLLTEDQRRYWDTALQQEQQA